MIHYDYIITEKSNTIVLVHGITQNNNIFKSQVEYFKNEFNLLLLDLRGHGRSSHLDGSYGVEEYTDNIQAIFNKLSLLNIIYWGTHTGTAIGLNLYLRNP